MVDENDLIVAQRDVFHGPGVYPTSQWMDDVPFGDTYVLRLPSTTFAPAQAHLTVGLYNRVTGTRLTASTGGDSVSFGRVQIQPRPGQFPNPQALRFDDGIALVGYTHQRQIASGDDMTLTLYWQARDIPSKNYKVFIHLVGNNGIRAAQHDSEPQAGVAPTASWTSGQTIIDRHPLQIAPDTPPGEYRLVVGLYEGDTGRRLHLLYDDGVSVQSDSITLSGVRVISP